MDPIKIKDVVNSVCGVAKNIRCKEIKDVVIDDRRVNDGSAFVAIKGEKFDGHDFIQSAIDNGASLIITEKEQLLVPQIIVEDTQRALLDLACFNRSRFSGMLVGITGSVGKTTTKEMVATVLGSKMNVLKTIGNLNNEIGLSKTLFGLNSLHEAAVVEMGMCNAGEISALSQTSKPTIGIITNIGTSHIENFDSRYGILKAKLEILDGMSDGSTLIVSGDDDKLKDIILPDHTIIKCGIENKDCDYFADDIKTDGLKTEFNVKYRGNSVHVMIPTVGSHNVLNALYAFAIGIIANIEPDKIASALSEYKAVGMRQKIFDVDGVTIIGDCYNASPESMKASMAALMTIPCKGKRIAVLGDMLELGEISLKAHEDIGKIAASFGIDVIYCCGTNAKYMYEGAVNYFKNKKGNCDLQIKHFENKEDLSEAVKKEIKKGDAILFKASRLMKFEDIIQNVFNCL